MLKILFIGFKDVRLVFRDRAALLLILLAPFLLTVGLGFVTGRFTQGASTGLSDIPVAVVNLDGGQLGNALVEVFQSTDLEALLAPSLSAGAQQARQMVDNDQAAAAVIIPAGFTRSIIPDNPAAGAASGPAVQIEVYTNPARPTGAAVVQSIVEEFLGRVELDRIGAEVSITQLVRSGRLGADPAALQAAGQQSGESLSGSRPLIKLQQVQQGKAAVDFDILAYMAPGMALMFLMYTVSYGGRSILAERSQGTLPRLLVSPTSSLEVLGGKVLGIYLTGLAQVSILIGASSVFFNVKWGDSDGIFFLVLAAVFAATGWGMLLTAVARTPGQVTTIGSALMLMFGILGGSFISLEKMPVYVQWISKITPNAWGLEGFSILAGGGTLADLGTPLLALGVMGALLFGLAVLFFNRSSLAQR